MRSVVLVLSVFTIHEPALCVCVYMCTWLARKVVVGSERVVGLQWSRMVKKPGGAKKKQKTYTVMIIIKKKKKDTTSYYYWRRPFYNCRLAEDTTGEDHIIIVVAEDTIDGAVKKKKQGGGGAVALVVRQVLAPATCVDSDFLPSLLPLKHQNLPMGAACGVVSLLDANRPSYFVQYKAPDDLFVFHFYFTRMTPFAEHWTASTPLDLHVVQPVIVGLSISMLSSCWSLDLDLHAVHPLIVGPSISMLSTCWSLDPRSPCCPPADRWTSISMLSTCWSLDPRSLCCPPTMAVAPQPSFPC